MPRFDDVYFPFAEPMQRLIAESIHQAMEREGKDLLVSLRSEVRSLKGIPEPKTPQEDKHEMIERLFTYHPPKGNQPTRYERIRELAREFAHELVEMTPDSLQQRLALEFLQLATMMANASIACNE